MNRNYLNSTYEASVTHGDTIDISKADGSDWVFIVATNGGTQNNIALRNKQLVEHLHFMLGQILKGQQ